MSWEKVKLGDVIIELASGGRPKGGAVDLGIPSLGAEHLSDDGAFNFSKVKYVPAEYFKTMKKGVVSRNDILIVKDGATTGKVSFVNGSFPFEKASINEHLFQIKVDNQKIEPKYLFYFLYSSEGQKQILSDFRGATVGGISREILDKVIFPLPPLPIQQKIAAILDQADALRKKDRLLLAKYDELLQAVFYDMFGDPVKNEKGWEKDIVINYCDCIVPGRDKPKSFSGNIPWVTTDDLEHLGVTTFSKRNIGLTRSEIDEVRGRIIPKNSVIMTCVGDLGIISIAGTEMVVNQQLHAFQTKEKLNNFFLMYMLSKRKDYMLRMATSTTVPYMNKTICNSIPILLPPLSLQTHFAHMYQNIIGQKSKLKHQIEQSENLFQCLLQQAFKGGGW